MPPVIDDNKCKKCGICADICPVDVFYGSNAKEVPVVTYGEDCFFCSACVLECSSNAIRLRYPLFAQPSYLSE